MKIIIGLLIILGVTSCVKVVTKPSGPPPVITFPHDNDTVQDSIPTLVGQTWVITGVRIGGIGNPTKTNDTLKFINNTLYKFNGYSSNYSLFYTGGGFNLSMNGTPWGYLSGTIYQYNLVSGDIQGLKFVDITPGTTNKTSYYVWMKKI